MWWSGPVTHRQHEAFTAWLYRERTTPTQAEWYLIQLTAATVGHKGPLKDLVLPFGGEAEHKPVSIEQADRTARARWGALLGVEIPE